MKNYFSILNIRKNVFAGNPVSNKSNKVLTNLFVLFKLLFVQNFPTKLFIFL